MEEYLFRGAKANVTIVLRTLATLPSILSLPNWLLQMGDWPQSCNCSGAYWDISVAGSTAVSLFALAIRSAGESKVPLTALYSMNCCAANSIKTANATVTIALASCEISFTALTFRRHLPTNTGDADEFRPGPGISGNEGWQRKGMGA